MGASLTVRGFLKLQSMDAGFRPDGVLVVGLPMSPVRYATYDQRVAFSQRVLEAMSSVPEVQSAAIGNGGLPFGGPQSSYSIGGQPKDDSRNIMLGLISSDYPQTMGIPLRAGRELARGSRGRDQ